MNSLLLFVIMALVCFGCIRSGNLQHSKYIKDKCLVENQFTINGNVFQCNLIKE